MKAIVYTKFGAPEVLKLQEVPKPILKENQILIRVKATSLYYLDYSRFEKSIETGKMPLSTKFMDTVMRSVGKVIGSEVSGIVEEIGFSVTDIHVGDEVFGTTVGLTGGLAEFALLDKLTAAKKPNYLTFEEAASIPLAGITAFGALADRNIKAGQKALVYGASGGVGLSLLQQLKAKGAHVTAVCSTRNIDIVNQYGADEIIDYKKQDISSLHDTFDFIVTANGYHPLNVYKKLLKETGQFIAIGNSKQMATTMFLGALFSNKNQKFSAANYFSTIKKPSLPYLLPLIEKGQLKPTVEKIYSAKDIKKAIAYLCQEHAKEKIVFTMDL